MMHSTSPGHHLHRPQCEERPLELDSAQPAQLHAAALLGWQCWDANPGLQSPTWRLPPAPCNILVCSGIPFAVCWCWSLSLSFILNISDSPPPANPPISFPVYSLFSPTRGNPYCDFHPHKLVLLILEPYINGITQHIFLGIWLILLNRMSVKFLRGVVYISSFLFIF